MRYCVHCGQSKPHDPTKPRMTKASGFYNTFCWDCRKKVVAESCRKHTEANRDKRRAASSLWSKNNPAAATALVVKRTAAKLNRTPAWVNHDLIKLVYVYADALGMTVDHVLPLQGRLVSGLHVYENLQLLTKSENTSKGNSFVPC